jgi:hypothetical protein
MQRGFLILLKIYQVELYIEFTALKRIDTAPPHIYE